jgi:deazaflavin-dependent oxidoreductase (nitroreductase family)
VPGTGWQTPRSEPPPGKYVSAIAADWILDALARDRTIDVTTTGARSGRAQRIEIWAWVAYGVVYLTGTPGRRDWYANLKANPQFTIHLKRGVQADLPARARPIEDPAERRAVFQKLRPEQVDAWTADAPLVEVEFAD